MLTQLKTLSTSYWDKIRILDFRTACMFKYLCFYIWSEPEEAQIQKTPFLYLSPSDVTSSLEIYSKLKRNQDDYRKAPAYFAFPLATFSCGQRLVCRTAHTTKTLDYSNKTFIVQILSKFIFFV
jgi:hypothetical protein